MASLRKASSYSKKKVRPYTRKSGKRKKAFIKTVPASKIVKFQMGSSADFRKGKHKYLVRFVCSEKVQIRDNALEACRTLLNKHLDKHIQGQYFFAIKVYPHHILRENKTAAGAGADRLSSGMKHSFGVTMGRAAIVNPGTEVFFISVSNERTARVAREAISKAKPKIPCKGRVVTEKVE
jgi:large subunit ribosomal protein L10e